MFWLGNPYTTGACYPQPSDMHPTQPFLPASVPAEQQGEQEKMKWGIYGSR